MEQSSKIQLFKQRNFSEKVEATFAFIRRNFKSFFGTMLVIVGPFLILTAIGTTFMTTRSMRYYNQPGVDPLEVFNSVGPSMFISMIGGFLSSLLIFAGTYGYLKVYHEVGQGEVTTKAVWKESLRQIPGLLGFFGILMAIMIGGVFLLKAFVLILMLVLAVVSVFWTIVPAIMAFEKVNPLKAMSRSFFLMSDKYFSTVGLIFVLFLIVVALGVLVSVPTYIMTFSELITLQEGGAINGYQQSIFLQVYNIITSILLNLGSTIISIGIVFQYTNLVERKEGVNLMDQINQMGTDR